MGKRKNSIFITPLFVILTVAMFIMALVSYWWDHYIFVAELIFAIAALAAVFVSMMNYKKYLTKIVTDAANSAEDVDIERINSIAMPVAVLGENNEIVIVNDIFKKNLINRFTARLTLPHKIHDVYRLHGILNHFNPPTLSKESNRICQSIPDRPFCLRHHYRFFAHGKAENQTYRKAYRKANRQPQTDIVGCNSDCGSD